MGLVNLKNAFIGVLTLATVSTGVFTELPDNLTEADVIIAGGGTSGSIIASRLAESNPGLSVLVIEQGQDSYNVTNIIYPALFERNTSPGSDTALFWKAKKSPQLADREPVIETGGTLGGGSAINWMVYTRGQWDDFDSWNTSGWTAEELLPFIQKRGWIDGAINAGFAEIEDLQSLHSNNGSGPWYRYVSPEDGRRQDVAHRYLYPLLQSGEYPNLHVLVETQVLRVLFEGDEKRAAGVEIRANPKFARSGQDQSKKSIKAKKLVVASAGSFGTPLLLERSGVGDPLVLEKAGVPVVEDLSGCLIDHHFVGYVYRTNLEQNETINGIARNDRGRDVEAMIASDDGQLGWNGHDASSKFRPSPADITAIGPEFQAAWDRDFRDSPNRPLMVMGLFNAYFGDPDALPDDAEYVTTAPWVTYPYARGHIHVTGSEIDDSYDFDPGWLLDENDIDLKSHVWGYKTQRSIARRMEIFRGELASGHPRFLNTSAAAVVEVADGPIAEDIEYSAEDDAAIVQILVDPSLNVHGVSGLKIADLSVPPQQVAANTYNAALLLGEKAADIIITELTIPESEFVS
ncbi:alcohol oxidase [Colletotrichum liriopes]|uniref:Alcohol oxidase n=1 Tax=Colletotrichum liriopes TaxID=708192 RepID=A0AA37GVC1_9PEZI|nr:alcohol oxidase [Colletotrichum liriopes]